MTGAQLIGDERRRQLERGYTPEHDQRWHEPDLIRAAVAILQRRVPMMTEPSPDAVAIVRRVEERCGRCADDEVVALRVAGALIAAEIDRVVYRDALARMPRKLSELKHV